MAFNAFVLPPNTVLCDIQGKRVAQYDFAQVMDAIAKSDGVAHIEEWQVVTARLKLQTFVRDHQNNVLHCACCGLQPTHVGVFYQPNAQRASLQLFGIENGVEKLFTHDHTLARALGGTDTLDNTTSMCLECNRNKARLESIFYEHRTELVRNYLQSSSRQTLSLSKLDELIQSTSVDQIDYKRLTGDMKLLVFFSKSENVTRALEQLASLHKCTVEEYIKQCNANEYIYGPAPLVTFPFARMFYPQFSKGGAQIFRLHCDNFLTFVWPDVIRARHSVPSVYYDMAWDKVIMPVFKGIHGTFFEPQHMQHLFTAYPQLRTRSTLNIGAISVQISPQASSALKKLKLWRDCKIAVRKTANGSTLLPIKIVNNIAVPLAWEQCLSTVVDIPDRVSRQSNIFQALKGVRRAQVLTHPLYLQELITILEHAHGTLEAIPQQGPINPDVFQALASFNLPHSVRNKVASVTWSTSEFFEQWLSVQAQTKHAQRL